MTAIAYTTTCNYTAHTHLAGRKVTKATVGLGEAEKEAAHVCVCVCVCVCVLDRCTFQMWPAKVRGSGEVAGEEMCDMYTV